MFNTCFPAGFYHIVSFGAKDHIVFLAALCGIYTFRQWRYLLALVTVFSIGHTTSLALTATQVIHPPLNIVEFLIPVTIFLTALQNVYSRENRRMIDGLSWSKYFFTFVFGLIHGMGFGSSADFSNCAMGYERLFKPLFVFTMGIEMGQLVVLGAILLVAKFFTTLFFFKQNEWNLFLSGIAGGISILLMIEMAGQL